MRVSLIATIVVFAACMVIITVSGCKSCDDYLQPLRNQVAAAQKRADQAEAKVQAAQTELAAERTAKESAISQLRQAEEQNASLHQVIANVRGDIDCGGMEVHP